MIRFEGLLPQFFQQFSNALHLLHHFGTGRQAIRAVGGEVSRGDLDGALSSHGWSANTVNTYLTRLCEKGFLSSRREGRNNLYTPLVSKDRYLEFESRSVLKRLYGGSLGSFVAALNAEQPLEQSEIDELRQFLDDMSR